MKNTRFVPAALLCCGALLVGAPAFADSHMDTKAAATAAAPAMTPEQQKAMTDEMMKQGMPGKEHAGLKAYEGKWKATVKSWMGPGEPSVSEGTMENTMTFGGRVLEGRYKGEFMGTPFEGVSLMGYDNMKKEYWSFWTDNMGTSAMMQTGMSTPDPNTIVVTGMMAGMDGKPTECTSTTKMVDANKHVMTMASKMGDQMVPMMEITYTRK